MSNSADDQYEQANDNTAEVTGEVGTDPDYVSRTGQSTIPVVRDGGDVGGVQESQDSDAQLERDDAEAIDKDNIVSGRTRGAKPEGSYSEGPDEDDLPTEALQSGRSSN